MCFIEPIKELKSQGKQLDGYRWNDKCHQWQDTSTGSPEKEHGGKKHMTLRQI